MYRQSVLLGIFYTLFAFLFIISQNKKRYYFCRLKEREENVKSDIFHCYIALLRQTKPTVALGPDVIEEEGAPIVLLQGQVQN